MFPMLKVLSSLLAFLTVLSAAELGTKKSLNLAAIKTMVAAAEAEATKRIFSSYRRRTARLSTPFNSHRRRRGTPRFTEARRRMALTQ
jgi:hypothetical protein